ncbi:MAG TPA: universal stress protein [Pseudonocardiaceae bacterium]|nr:universal stress protein [Pseudonocardiaceae bacterium]
MNTVSSTPGSVVVGVDGSQAALHAVRWAAADARNAECALSLVHALEWPLVGFPVPTGLRADWTQQMVEQGRRWLKEAQEAAESAAPGVPTQVHLFTGEPRATLLAEAQHARELVVGSRGLGGFTRMLLGSTSAAVTLHASCPVVAVVHGQGDAAGPVVVGLDGSAASEHALEYAFQAAARAGAALRAVHAWDDLGTLHSPMAPAEALPVNEIEGAAHRMLTEQLTNWREKYPDIVVERQVIHEQPAVALIELGRQARMIVVGFRGRGGFARLLLGSVSQTVVRHATCPVVVCRGNP